ncbi:ABC transporter permease [Clostridia bacterium]|nr:ABC transporter permease [Clostridia bacterium]
MPNKPLTGFSLVISMLRGRKYRVVIVFFALFAMIILDAMIPQLIRFFIDNILQDGEVPSYLSSLVTSLGGIDTLRVNMWIFPVVFLVCVFTNGAISSVRRYFIVEPSEYFAMNLRNKLFAHIEKLPFIWHVKNQTGDIIQRCTSDVDTLRGFLSNDFFEVVRCVFVISISLTAMILMDPSMTLAAVALLPVLLTFSVLYYRSVEKKFKAADEAEGTLSAAVQENYTGVRVVRAFGREKFETDRFDKKNRDWVEKNQGLMNSLSNCWSFSDIVGGLQIALVMIVGIYKCVNGDMSVGTLQSFYAYTSMLVWPVRNLGRTLTNFSKASVSSKRIGEILAAVPEEIDNTVKVEPDRFKSVEFKNVTFGYNSERNILANISFTLKRGETLGILGGTGSGKSTIAYLLTRLYDINEESGAILIDGVNINDLPLASVRKNISLVLQEPFLFSKTIGENIMSGGISGKTGDQTESYLTYMQAAAKIADIHDSIEEFPAKYDTIVGERGVTLSGGQKQRVAIARSLVTKAPVMIFDDSLSAVDTETDAKIRSALKQSTGDAAVIIISHRIGTLRGTDKILVLHEGKAEDFGTHEELIAREGTYKRVYDLQSAVNN